MANGYSDYIILVISADRTGAETTGDADINHPYVLILQIVYIEVLFTQRKITDILVF